MNKVKYFIYLILVVTCVFLFQMGRNNNISNMVLSSESPQSKSIKDDVVIEKAKNNIGNQVESVSAVSKNSDINNKIKMHNVKQRVVATQTVNKHHLEKKIIQNLNPKWLYVKNYTAIQKSLFRGSLNDTLGEVQGRLIYENSADSSSPEEFDTRHPLVFYDDNRKQYALLTGVYIITLSTNEDYQKLVDDYNFEVVNYFAHLNIVFLKPRLQTINLNEVSSQLSSDSRVTKFEYEIIQGNLVKN